MKSGFPTKNAASSHFVTFFWGAMMPCASRRDTSSLASSCWCKGVGGDVTHRYGVIVMSDRSLMDMGGPFIGRIPFDMSKTSGNWSMMARTALMVSSLSSGAVVSDAASGDGSRAFG